MTLYFTTLKHPLYPPPPLLPACPVVRTRPSDPCSHLGLASRSFTKSLHAETLLEIISSKSSYSSPPILRRGASMLPRCLPISCGLMASRGYRRRRGKRRFIFSSSENLIHTTLHRCDRLCSCDNSSSGTLPTPGTIILKRSTHTYRGLAHSLLDQ